MPSTGADEPIAAVCNGPRNRAYLLAAIECVEGKRRLARRSRRLLQRQLSPEMEAAHEQRFAALKPVTSAIG